MAASKGTVWDWVSHLVKVPFRKDHDTIKSPSLYCDLSWANVGLFGEHVSFYTKTCRCRTPDCIGTRQWKALQPTLIKLRPIAMFCLKVLILWFRSLTNSDRAVYLELKGIHTTDLRTWKLSWWNLFGTVWLNILCLIAISLQRSSIVCSVLITC